MRPFYTLALMAAVTFGASAHRSIYSGEKTIPVLTTVAAKAKVSGIKEVKALDEPVQKPSKAASKSASVEDIEALNVWSCYSMLPEHPGSSMVYLSVTVTDEAAGAVAIMLMNAPEYTLSGIFNAEESTLTIPNRQYLFDDEEGPVYFYFKDIDDDDNILPGASEVEEIVGDISNGVVEFPYEYIWAAGNPEAEDRGFYFLTAENYFEYNEELEWQDKLFENAYLCPNGRFNENLIYYNFTLMENTEYVDVEVYSNGEGYYKVIDPFQSVYAALGADMESPAMIINATDPDNIVLDFQSTNIYGGADGVYAYASSNWYFEPDELITKTVEGNTVTINFPYNSTILYAPNPQIVYYGSEYPSTLVFTENGETAVDTVETASEASVSYYNLQGVRVKNPQGIVIRVEDGKATKLFIK